MRSTIHLDNALQHATNDRYIPCRRRNAASRSSAVGIVGRDVHESLTLKKPLARVVWQFSDPHAHVKDFEVLWLDDHLDKLITPLPSSLSGQRPAMLRMLRTVVLDAVAEAGGTIGLTGSNWL